MDIAGLMRIKHFKKFMTLITDGTRQDSALTEVMVCTRFEIKTF